MAAARPVVLPIQIDALSLKEVEKLFQELDSCIQVLDSYTQRLLDDGYVYKFAFSMTSLFSSAMLKASMDSIMRIAYSNNYSEDNAYGVAIPFGLASLGFMAARYWFSEAESSRNSEMLELRNCVSAQNMAIRLGIDIHPPKFYAKYFKLIYNTLKEKIIPDLKAEYKKNLLNLHLFARHVSDKNVNPSEIIPEVKSFLFHKA